MTYVDVDSDSATFNSSTANQTLPSGSTILWAGLYWGGDYSTGTAALAGDAARMPIAVRAIPATAARPANLMGVRVIVCSFRVLWG